MLMLSTRLTSALARPLSTFLHQATKKSAYPIAPIAARLLHTSSTLNDRVSDPVSTDTQKSDQPQHEPQQHHQQPMQSQAQPDQATAVDQSTEKAGDAQTPGGSRRFLNLTKVSNEVRRNRRNHRLRRLLLPKNALTSLHEFVGELKLDVVPDAAHGFVATIIINDAQYEGYGKSKTEAKNDAAEKAMRAIVIEHMLKAPRGADYIDGETEVPMAQLASFALHQLYGEWEADGIEVPDFKEGITSVPAADAPSLDSMVVDDEPDTAVPDDVKPDIQVLDDMLSNAANSRVHASSDTESVHPPTKRFKLPDNAESMNPVVVLNLAYPHVKFIELGSDGEGADELFHIGIDIDESEFLGTAPSKKMARKFAAIEACNRLLGTSYVKDTNGPA